MYIFKYFLLAAICFALIDPIDGGFFSKISGKSVCEALFGIACPLLVGATELAIDIQSSGLGTAVVAAGGAITLESCRVKTKTCKGSVSSTEIMLPFSDEFRHFDKNSDNKLSYEEFVFAIMKSVDLENPGELRELFKVAERDGDDHIDEKEFQNAPFLFANAYTLYQGIV